MIQRVEAGRELRQTAMGDLGKALPDLITQGVTEVSLDTSRVLDFDSGTLEGILEFEALAQSRGLSVTVVSPSELLATALAITGVMDRIPIQDAAGRPLSSAAVIARLVDDSDTSGGSS